jgi:hypothetical protein
MIAAGYGATITRSIAISLQTLPVTLPVDDDFCVGRPAKDFGIRSRSAALAQPSDQRTGVAASSSRACCASLCSTTTS